MASKNPKVAEAKKLFEDAAPRAAARLIYLMENGSAEIQLAACKVVIEHGLGKPRQPITDDEGNPITVNLISYGTKPAV